MASEKNNWLDDVLAKAIGCEKREPDFTKWRQEHPDAVQMLKSQATRQTRPRSLLYIGKIIMRSPITKLAVAAVIIIVVLAGIYLLTGKTPEVTCCAWAQIADRVEQIKTCICRLHVRQASGSLGIPQVESDVFISSDYGSRTDTYTAGILISQTYVLPKEEAMITVMPYTKKYMRTNFSDEDMPKLKQQGQDPRDMVKDILSSSQYSNLGRSTIDGVEVEGIEVVNPPAVRGIYENFIGKLWIDLANEMPVRLEFSADVPVGNQKSQISMVMDDFKWQIDLDPGVFEPNIPTDYNMMADMKMPRQDEASAIEGLRAFAEISGGRYPSQMNVLTLSYELGEILAKKAGSDPNKMLSEGQMQQMMSTNGVFMFYNKLARDGNDPAYYGKDVSAGDANAVLMRWKISDDTYRVIYGDLSAENVSAGQLKEMEEAVNQ
jgi:hypothetical protein